MREPWIGRSSKAIGQRLTLTRDALGLSKKDFALAAQMLANHLGEVEDGKKGIGVDKVRNLKDAFGVTLDWVYDGDIDGLPLKLATAIRGLQGVRAPAPPRPPTHPTN